MGAACCVAAKDRTIVHGPSGGLRHARHSPSWSFRWDNRVAGEETHPNWLLDGFFRNDQVEIESGTSVQTSFASVEGSPRDRLQLHWKKLSVSDGNATNSKLQNSDEGISRNVVEVKDSTESPAVSNPSSASPPTSQSHLHRPNSTPSRCRRKPHPLHEMSAIQIPECKSPPFSFPEEASSRLPPDWGSESTGGSNGGSLDSWSIPVSSNLTTTRRERFTRWSFDSEISGFSLYKIGRSSRRRSDSSIDFQTCGACAMLLSERSLWGWSGQKIVSTNELAVVSILNCGHVYHAECLEHITPEINKYDPSCPVCTYGEKQSLKICEKALEAELDLKASERSRKRDLKSNISVKRHEHVGAEEKGSKIVRSSSSGKSFFKRHFSFSSKSGKPLPENQFTQRKGFFCTRSTEE